MATYSVTTTAAQERALTYHVAKYNADPQNTGAPTVTNALYLKNKLDHQLDALVEALRQQRKDVLEQKYEDAPAATKTAVNTALGYTE